MVVDGYSVMIDSEDGDVVEFRFEIVGELCFVEKVV